MFCADPGVWNFCGAFDSGDTQGLENDLLDAAQTRVVQYIGNGNINPLLVPPEGQDRRYYFKEWSLAYAKYLTSPAVSQRAGSTRGALLPGSLCPPVFGGGTRANPNCPTTDSQLRRPGSGPFSQPVHRLRQHHLRRLRSAAARAEVNTSTSTSPTSTTTRSTSSRRQSSSGPIFRTRTSTGSSIAKSARLFNTLATGQDPGVLGVPQGRLGNPIYDYYSAFDPTTGASIACTQDSDCTGLRNWVCEDKASKQCFARFQRHNANPLLTNLAGSLLVSTIGYAAQTDMNGNRCPRRWSPSTATRPRGTTRATPSLIRP